MSILVDFSLQHCTESYIQLQATLIHSTTYVVLTLDFPQLNITKVLRMCAQIIPYVTYLDTKVYLSSVLDVCRFVCEHQLYIDE